VPLQDSSAYLQSTEEEDTCSAIGHVAQIDMEPPSGSTFPTAPESDLQVLHSTVVVQHQPDAKKDLALMAYRRIEVPE
jgi:hypothetical protein